MSKVERHEQHDSADRGELFYRYTLEVFVVLGPRLNRRVQAACRILLEMRGIALEAADIPPGWLAIILAIAGADREFPKGLEWS